MIGRVGAGKRVPYLGLRIKGGGIQIGPSTIELTIRVG
jgi:hypothetical protein